jgi:predicted nucleic acid-binding protein
MKTALDSKVLSSLWSAEPSAPRVRQQLIEARAQGSIVVCGPVYAELAAYPSASPGVVDRLLTQADIVVEFVLDESVWRMAAKAFASYAQRRRRSAGGSPKRLLVDFVIAAHASLQADRLMTLDPSRYRQDFPKLRIV